MSIFKHSVGGAKHAELRAAVELVAYFLLLRLFGMAQLGEEFAEFGLVMLLVLLAMGNFTFFLLDRLLGMGRFRRKVG